MDKTKQIQANYKQIEVLEFCRDLQFRAGDKRTAESTIKRIEDLIQETKILEEELKATQN